jgi:hypothetical protein
MATQRDWKQESAEKAQAIVRDLSDWVNGMGHDNRVFVEALIREHRTLQQQIFELMLACIDAWAKEEHFDLRNEFTVKKCREIMNLFPGGPAVPFI